MKRAALFLLLLAAAARADDLPANEEVWALIREAASRYYVLDQVEYDVPATSEELTALVKERAGGLFAAPDLVFSRHGGINKLKLSFRDLPEIFRPKAEAKVEELMNRVTLFAFLRDFGWTMVAACFRMLESARDFEVVSWTPEQAVVEFNELSEPFLGSTMRSLRLTLDRRRVLMLTGEMWFGANRYMHARIDYETERFFPGTRVPLVSRMAIEQQGFDGPPKASLVPGEGRYFLPEAGRAGDPLSPLRARLNASNVSRALISKAAVDEAGGFRVTLAGAPLKTLPDFSGLPVHELDLRGTSIADFAPLRGLPLRKLVLDEIPVASLAFLEGMPLESLSLAKCGLTELATLPRLPLRSLDLSQNPRIQDLAPLAGLPLEKLHLDTTGVRDLAPLRGMSLRQLSCNQTSVADLQALAEMPLEHLEAGGTSVTDLAPLRELKRLSVLYLHNTRVRDLAALRGLPLRILRLDATDARDLTPLVDCPTLEQLTVPDVAKDFSGVRDLALLRYLSRGWDTTKALPAKSATEFFAAESARADRMTSTVEVLKAAGVAPRVSLNYDGNIVVDLSREKILPLEQLATLPIHTLNLGNTDITDLGPLRGFASLRYLGLNNCTKLRDLSPLAGLTLARLDLDGVQADLEPLRQLPLHVLFAPRSSLADLRVLQAMPLLELTAAACPGVRDLEPLRGKRLTLLNLAQLDLREVDLRVLATLPLRELKLHRTQLPPRFGEILRGCTKLEKLVLPAGTADAAEIVRGIPSLQSVAVTDAINSPLHPVADFLARQPKP